MCFGDWLKVFDFDPLGCVKVCLTRARRLVADWSMVGHCTPLGTYVLQRTQHSGLYCFSQWLGAVTPDSLICSCCWGVRQCVCMYSMCVRMYIRMYVCTQVCTSLVVSSLDSFPTTPSQQAPPNSHMGRNSPHPSYVIPGVRYKSSFVVPETDTLIRYKQVIGTSVMGVS